MTREEAKREILFAKREVMADSWIDKAYDMAIKALEEAEIIRCKDCMYFDNGWCDYLDTTMGMSDFCSRAERRTDEQTVSE